MTAVSSTISDKVASSADNENKLESTYLYIQMEYCPRYKTLRCLVFLLFLNRCFIIPFISLSMGLLWFAIPIPLKYYLISLVLIGFGCGIIVGTAFFLRSLDCRHFAFVCYDSDSFRCLESAPYGTLVKFCYPRWGYSLNVNAILPNEKFFHEDCECVLGF